MASICRLTMVCLFAACAVAACQRNPAAPSNAGAGSMGAAGEVTPPAADDDQWLLNGPTACAKYLTPDEITAVFGSASGDSQPNGPHACTFSTAHAPNTDYSTINIYLSSGGSVVFDQDVDTKNGTPLSGVGDKAVRTQEDGVQAVKGDHICNIGVKPPAGNKLQGDALARKLGEVCNKLFSLP